MHKLLVANRGEIACRVLRSARALGLRTVAVYSEADEGALHTRLADEAVALAGSRAAETYLNKNRLIEIARDMACQLIHPGYGFLSENADFASRCEERGLVFVGPSAAVIAAMGDKAQARGLAREAGVPILPGSARLGSEQTDILETARRVGFPLLVKAAAGGGGIGMRIVTDAETLIAAVSNTAAVAEKHFGDGGVYLEHFVERARHLEVQVFGFGDGEAAQLYTRECSLQRRHQKIVEEALPPGVPAEKLQMMAEQAIALTRACRYDGAGTVEFVYDDRTAQYFFLEMNTRIQVEHPVTEMVLGVDLVAAQIAHALGQDVRARLGPANLQPRGHAVEARLYAERPERNFLPSPGLLQQLRLPRGDQVRVDTGYEEGQRISPYYDPLIMKIIAWGADRPQALHRLSAALLETEVVGVATNRVFLIKLLDHEEVKAGRLHTDLVNQFMGQFATTDANTSANA